MSALFLFFDLFYQLMKYDTFFCLQNSNNLRHIKEWICILWYPKPEKKSAQNESEDWSRVTENDDVTQGNQLDGDVGENGGGRVGQAVNDDHEDRSPTRWRSRFQIWFCLHTVES